ncbi:MAG: hypothetical protein K8R85_07640 [Bacteroidetes bacterium]|nr:hypothetical protein [Bacteroidota bacterium]
MNKSFTLKIIFICFFVGFTSRIQVKSQSLIWEQKTLELDTKLSAMRASQVGAIKAESIHLISLISDLLPSLYFEQGKLVGTYKENPIVLFTDASSLRLFSDLDPIYNKIQIISIKIKKPDDLQKVLKISDLTAFANLKYIYFICDFNICPDQPKNSSCVNEKISAMIQRTENSSIEILYKTNIGS